MGWQTQGDYVIKQQTELVSISKTRSVDPIKRPTFIPPPGQDYGAVSSTLCGKLDDRNVYFFLHSDFG